jgi:lysophospholipase L1-like esterase
MMENQTMFRRLIGTAALAAMPLVSACDKDSLTPPTADVGGAMFARYVAIGNSVTAGFQSGGINESTQLDSYAVLLAEALGLDIGTEFNVPLLNNPGCPPPFTNIFTQTRQLGLGSADCFVRKPPITAYLNNVAVPGAAVIDAFTNLDPASGPNPLTTVFLGGRTQLDVAEEMQPTFVTVWIGNNDALGAILEVGNAGDPALVTGTDTFTSRYTQMMDRLDAIGTIEGGVLIGVVQVGLAPYLTQGRAWLAFEQTFDGLTAPLNALDVNINCLANQVLTATDTAWVSVPFHMGGPLLSLANARIDSVQGGLLAPQDLQTVTMDCSVQDAVTISEMVNLFASITAFNATIEAAADERGWIYVDPNLLLAQLAADPTMSQIRPFPAFDPDDPQHETAPFGTALSLDGFHPSSSSHVLVANALIQTINAAYDLNVPPVP